MDILLLRLEQQGIHILGVCFTVMDSANIKSVIVKTYNKVEIFEKEKDGLFKQSFKFNFNMVEL